MRAALPAGINASVEQTISITEKGREELKQTSTSDVVPKTLKETALRLLADEREFEVNALLLRLGLKRIPQWLRELENDGLIRRSYRARATPTRAKRRRAVRLVSEISANS